MPLESVNALADGGLNPPVESVVVKLTATLDAALPLVSFTFASTKPGFVGETVDVALPDESDSVSVKPD
jgi:hypothetical protein